MLMIGDRIRQLRQSKGLTIAALAELAGVSKSMISQVENDSANPSIETVRSIASGLEVPLFTLFLEDEKPNGALVRRDERIKLTIPGSEASRELLSPDLQRKMALLVSRIPAGAKSSPEPVTHQGEECVVVLQGTLVVELQGERYQLEEGDALYFNPQLPHLFRNPGSSVVEILTAITPPIVYGQNGSRPALEAATLRKESSES